MRRHPWQALPCRCWPSCRAGTWFAQTGSFEHNSAGGGSGTKPHFGARGLVQGSDQQIDVRGRVGG